MSKRIYVVDEESVEAYPHIFTIGLTALSNQIYNLDENGLLVLKHKSIDPDNYKYRPQQLISFIGDDRNE